MEYRKFTLSPGQQSPAGSTGVGLSSGWIVWYGEEKTFPKKITSEMMSQAEIDEYIWIKAFPDRIAEATAVFQTSALNDVLYSKIETDINAKNLSLVEMRKLITDLYKIVLALLKFNGLVK